MYHYSEQRANLFTEDGQVQFLKIRDNSKRLLKEAGAVRMQELMSGVSGDSWTMLACADRLVELGEIVEVPNPHSRAGQDRIFIKARS